jgi:hypothetical protein
MIITILRTPDMGGVSLPVGTVVSMVPALAVPLLMSGEAISTPTSTPTVQVPDAGGGAVEYSEHANLAAFPATGDADVIYVAVDTAKMYRWTGSAYAELSGSDPVAIRATTLTGLDTVTITQPTASDTILSALGKLIGKLYGYASEALAFTNKTISGANNTLSIRIADLSDTSAYAKTLLDDTTQAQARQTLGIVDGVAELASIVKRPSWRVIPLGSGGVGMHAQGIAVAIAGTGTARAVVQTNAFTMLPRLGAISAAAANSPAGIATDFTTPLWSPSETVDTGWWDCYAMGGAEGDALTGCRTVIGLTAGARSDTVEPSAMLNTCFLGADSGDTQMTLMHNAGSGTATKVTLSGDWPSNGNGANAYLLYLKCYSFPNRRIEWIALNLKSDGTTLTASGTVLHSGGKMPVQTANQFRVNVIRSTAANATACSMSVMGLGSGFYAHGAAMPDSSVPREITGASSFGTTDYGCLHRFNSGSTAAITVGLDSANGAIPGKSTFALFIQGTAVPTFTAGGATIVNSPPGGLAQNSTMVLQHTGVANTWSYV